MESPLAVSRIFHIGLLSHCIFFKLRKDAFSGRQLAVILWCFQLDLWWKKILLLSVNFEIIYSFKNFEPLLCATYFSKCWGGKCFSREDELRNHYTMKTVWNVHCTLHEHQDPSLSLRWAGRLLGGTHICDDVGKQEKGGKIAMTQVS
jgi:hypothetical protein